MSLRPQLEAIIYAAETPISLDQILSLVKESLLAETPGIDAAEMKSRLRATLEELIADYSGAGHGIEIRQVAGGYRMSTKPEQHDVVRAFAKSLKPPFRLSLPALETLAVIAYKQPVTVPEISEIRGVDAGGVIATLLDRKLITTAGRKAVIGRPILYKTSKEFLLRFGLKDIHELPSMEEFEKLLAESFQSDLLPGEEQTKQSTEDSLATAPNADEAEMSEGSEAKSSAETALEVDQKRFPDRF
jgi:segregation and condensation protein B